MRNVSCPLAVFLVSAFCSLTCHAAPTLAVGSAAGQAGSAVDLVIQFDPGTDAVASLQFNLTLPPSVSTASVSAGAILTSAGKTFASNLRGNTWTFIAFGLNQTLIGKGTLGTAHIRIAPGTPAGNLRIPISTIVYSDPKGLSQPGGRSTGGTIAVSSARAKPTDTGSKRGDISQR